MSSSTFTVAIVGASADRKKYGNKSVRAHLQAGWRVYPIHPNADQIEGLDCYPNVSALPQAVDRISVYLPPSVSFTLLEEWAGVGAKACFFNPGSATPRLLKAAKKAGLPVVEACSILNLGLKPSMFPDE